MSDEKKSEPEPSTPAQMRSVQTGPEVCWSPECVKVIYQDGKILDVTVSKTCPIDLKDKARRAAEELLNGKIKMRYTVEE
jgi:hypothetical protein